MTVKIALEYRAPRNFVPRVIAALNPVGQTGLSFFSGCRMNEQGWR